MAELEAKEGEEAETEAEADQEEGEIDEWAGMFMVDVTPSVVKPEAAFGSTSENDPPVPAKDADAMRKEEEAEGRRAKEATLKEEEEQMRLFAEEVADSNDSSSEADHEEEEERGAESKGEVLYDNEAELQKAIQHKIVDDSAAKVSSCTLFDSFSSPDPQRCGACIRLLDDITRRLILPGAVAYVAVGSYLWGVALSLRRRLISLLDACRART